MSRVSRAAAVVISTFLILGAVATAAFASSVSDGNATYVRQHYSSVSWGTMAFSAQCPSGSEPVGGGGYVTATHLTPDEYWESPSTSSEYDDGNKGWRVTFSIPSFGTYDVDVFAICRT